MMLIRSCAQCNAQKRAHQRWYLLICPDGTLLELCDSDCLLRHRQAYDQMMTAKILAEVSR